MRSTSFSRVAGAALAAAALGSAAATAGAATTTLTLGQTYVVDGRTAAPSTGPAKHAVGLVVVRGRWGNGHWRIVTTTRTDTKGRYHFTVTPGRRGILTLRITPPDHRSFVERLRVV